MTRFAFVATVALSTAPLFAGVRIQSENTDLSTKKVTTDVILLDANRMRMDSDDGRSVLFLTDGGRDRMVMLDRGRVLKIGARSEFEAIRDAETSSLNSNDERLIHQFLNGNTQGPLTDADGMSEYEKLIIEG